MPCCCGFSGCCPLLSSDPPAEGVHSREAIDMVKEHVLAVLGPASMAFSNTMIKMSKLQAAQVRRAGAGRDERGVAGHAGVPGFQPTIMQRAAAQRLHLSAADSTCCLPLAVLRCRRCMLRPSCLATSCAAWTSASSWPSRWGPAVAEGSCCCWERARGKAALSTARATRALCCDARRCLAAAAVWYCQMLQQVPTLLCTLPPCAAGRAARVQGGCSGAPGAPVPHGGWCAGMLRAMPALSPVMLGQPVRHAVHLWPGW